MRKTIFSAAASLAFLLPPPSTVEWGNVTARVNDGANVIVVWSAVADINNDFFIVERSYDGVFYEEISKDVEVVKIGYSTDYQFIDSELRQGARYYRIRQIDRDGNQSLSRTIVVNVGGGRIFHLQTNIVHSTLTLENDDLTVGNRAEFSIFNLNGQPILRGQFSENAAEQTIQISNLPTGFYTLRVVENGRSTALKFVKN